MPVADPDGRGTLRGTDLGIFRGDADPATTTSPLDPDTDEGGARDDQEDRDRNGALDPGGCAPQVTRSRQFSSPRMTPKERNAV